MKSYKSWEGLPDEKEISAIAEREALKLLGFVNRPEPYYPHVWQLIFHGARAPSGNMARFRHLVAGRRGGKTLSAAEDFAHYMLNPGAWWEDFRGRNSNEPLWGWILAKNYPEGFPSMREFLAVLRRRGLSPNVDFKYHKGEKYIEFHNDSFVQFKTADDPESLRGAGLNMLWIDEAADIPTADAYNVTYPALSDKIGCVITTTTPKGKNWYFDEFFDGAALTDPDQVAVQYMTIDNPHIEESEWLRAQRRFHPVLFKQEYMARFDAMAGIELAGDWLQYFNTSELPRMKDNKQLDLKLYVGVDPAISTRDDADRFAMALIGISQDNSQAFLLDLYAGRIPFPDQIDKIREWHIKYRPLLIGIESNAYQAALAQQAMRMENFPPVIPILSVGKKQARILAMAPYFKIGRIRIHQNHRDFIDEWVSYDSTRKNSKDDTLDAVEIALRTAGALLPDTLSKNALTLDDDMRPARDIHDLAKRDLATIGSKRLAVDDEMGEEW